MRRLVVEIPLESNIKFQGKESPLSYIESVEILLFLKHDIKEFAVISKILPKDRECKIEDFVERIRDVHGRGTEIQLLDHEKEGTCTCFIRGKLQAHPFSFNLKDNGGYITTPFELRNGNLRLTFLGSVKQAKGLLQNIRKTGMHCRVVSLTDARFSQDSPLSRLTEKQRRVLITAYNSGYYDRPRGISSDQLAKRLNLVSSTFVVHRQKAEKRILAAILDRS
jgi:predicted DNA binding protein